jgi:tetratricopeptide (TPR) repeat protein
MPLIADRFLADDDGDVVDLATGDAVRLDVDRAPSDTRSRAALCDRLASLRHPLLLPIVDYGMWGDRWFEAHARLPPLRASAGRARDAALHLVRFLRAAGVELSAGAAARNVRPAVEARAPLGRPVGVFLQARRPLDAVRTVIESPGPPGVTAIAIHAPWRGGLRTARLQVARAARLAGYHVVDSRFGTLEHALAPPRHLCVLDWLPASRALPAVLSLAAARGARRHAWIRFCRVPVAGPGTIGLEPLMTRELTASIYVDADLGPSPADVAHAARMAGGLPGLLVEALSAPRGWRGGTMWVHETAPEYGVGPAPGPQPQPAPPPASVDAGVARLLRGVEAARAVAARGRHGRASRALARCAAGLAARGAMEAAAGAACLLGELLLDRAQPRHAASAFEDAGRWRPDGAAGLRALVGRGRALMEQGRLEEAEGALRTAILAEPDPCLARTARGALAELLCARGRVDAAEDIAAGLPASRSAIRLLKGDVAGAAQAALDALRDADAGDSRAVCGAHLAAADVEAALGHVDRARAHLRDAEAAAARARVPALRLRAAAAACACLARCGVATGAAARTRLLRAASRLPPFSAARVRAALGMAIDSDASLRRRRATTRT